MNARGTAPATCFEPNLLVEIIYMYPEIIIIK